VLQGHVPKRGRSRPAIGALRHQTSQGRYLRLRAAARPERGHNKTRNQRESARSTVFFNTNLTTTKPL